MNVDNLELIKVLVPALASGIAGYFLKYYLDKKQQFITKNSEVKREAYQEFINLYVDLLGNSQADYAVNNLRNFYKKYVLFGSPKVIKALSNLLQYFYGDPSFTSRRQKKRAMRKMSKVFKAMRKDIGLSNRGLGVHGELLLRAIINDYDSFMYPRWYIGLKEVYIRISDKVLAVFRAGRQGRNSRTGRAGGVFK